MKIFALNTALGVKMIRLKFTHKVTAAGMVFA